MDKTKCDEMDGEKEGGPEEFWDAMKHRYAGTPGEEPHEAESNPNHGDGPAATNEGGHP